MTRVRAVQDISIHLQISEQLRRLRLPSSSSSSPYIRAHLLRAMQANPSSPILPSRDTVTSITMKDIMNPKKKRRKKRKKNVLHS